MTIKNMIGIAILGLIFLAFVIDSVIVLGFTEACKGWAMIIGVLGTATLGLILMASES